MAFKKTIGWTNCIVCGKSIRLWPCRPNQKWCSKACRCRTPEERFWWFVEKKGDDDCWPWNGSTNECGAGRFRARGKSMVLAPRFSWELHFGRIEPSTLLVCHHCDNRNCVNPKHLFLGTVQDNADDRQNKNRQAKGSRNGTSKLRERDIPLIRSLYKRGIRERGAADIAKWFGVCDQTIFDIVNGRWWRHVA